MKAISKKRKIAFVLVALILVVAAAVILWWVYPKLDNLGDETIAAIKSDYLSYRNENLREEEEPDSDEQKISYFNYLGKNKNYTAVCIKDDYYAGLTVITDIYIDGVYFGKYGDSGYALYLYDETAEVKDKFIPMQKAYEDSKINKSDLKKFGHYALVK